MAYPIAYAEQEGSKTFLYTSKWYQITLEEAFFLGQLNEVLGVQQSYPMNDSHTIPLIKSFQVSNDEVHQRTYDTPQYTHKYFNGNKIFHSQDRFFA
jgi:hypothetical protein